jgi:hypothetical protein
MEPTERRREREARIGELEQRLASRPRAPVRRPLLVLGLALCVWMLWSLRGDLAYALSPSEPLTLGAEGDYHFDRLSPERFAQIHGTPLGKGVYVGSGSSARMAVALWGTPLIVLRSLVAGEELPERGNPPPPNPSPLAVRGRLYRGDEAGVYAPLFSRVPVPDGQRGPARWLLVQGSPPGRDWATFTEAFLLLAVALVCLRMLLRQPPLLLKRRVD